MHDMHACMIKLILVGQFFYTDNILKPILQYFLVKGSVKKKFRQSIKILEIYFFNRNNLW
jgi:hypothetical protein